MGTKVQALTALGAVATGAAGVGAAYGVYRGIKGCLPAEEEKKNNDDDGFFSVVRQDATGFFKSLVPESVAEYAGSLPSAVTYGAAAILALGGAWGVSKLWRWCCGSKDADDETLDTESNATSAARGDEAEAADQATADTKWYKDIGLMVSLGIGLTGALVFLGFLIYAMSRSKVPEYPYDIENPPFRR